MKYKKFDVVEIKNKNKATILEIEGNKYFAEIVNPYGITIENRLISDNEVSKLLHSRKKIRER